MYFLLSYSIDISLFIFPGFFQVASMLPPEAFSVIRKSFDARKVRHISFSKGLSR